MSERATNRTLFHAAIAAVVATAALWILKPPASLIDGLAVTLIWILSLVAFRALERQTDLEQAQRLEMEKLAALGRMTAGVAHEINNPLAGIKNSFLLVKGAVPDDHRYQPYVAMIDQEIERITRIVRHMLAHYGPQEEKPRAVDAGKLLEEMCLFFERKMEKRGISLELDVRLGLPEFMVLEGNVRQIIYNLIQNAVESSDEGGRITVSARAEGDELHLTVSDQGPGIEADVLPRIFDPFFSTGKSIGLGLSLSHSLAMAMGGTITVKTAPGKGSAFTLSLPRDPSA